MRAIRLRVAIPVVPAFSGAQGTAADVVNVPIKANRTFDLLVIPGAGHTSGGPYGDRKPNDFFVHHLLGVEPSERNAVTAASASGTGNP